jgi:hypothetical protein
MSWRSIATQKDAGFRGLVALPRHQDARLRRGGPAATLLDQLLALELALRLDADHVFLLPDRAYRWPKPGRI